MRRVFLLTLLVGITALAVGWLAADPGRLTLDFRGWRVETTAAVLVAAVALVAVAAALGWSALSWMLNAPRRWRRWRARRRLRRGLKALAAGMVAVAAGDARVARRQASRAALASAETPLVLLLSAQAAQLEGDERAAEKYFTAMLDDPETEFLGLRGLLVQAAREGDTGRALALAERASKLRPAAGWAHAALFELAVKQGEWKKAEAALGEAVRRGAIAREPGRRHRAALLLMEAAAAERSGFAVEALALAKRAARAAPDSVPAALVRARLERDQGRLKRARRFLERAFAANPHPEIARALLSFAEGEGEALAQDRLRLAQRLLERAPEAAEAHATAAEAALDARLWGRAGKHLDEAEERLGGAPEDSLAPARYFRLRARIAEGADGDARAAGHWLLRAANAAPDPRWVCAACGFAAAQWSALCGHCGGFDTLEWRSALGAPPGASGSLPGHQGPGRLGPALAALAAAERPAAGVGPGAPLIKD